ncbi:MAG TPA: hypothetical protein VF719_03670 [Abditibacteriaceae bacterium]|jgi:hypothetical protein
MCNCAEKLLNITQHDSEELQVAKERFAAARHKTRFLDTALDGARTAGDRKEVQRLETLFAAALAETDAARREVNRLRLPELIRREKFYSSLLSMTQRDRAETARQLELVAA